MIFRIQTGRARGVKQMIVTHAMDSPIFMNVAQMKEAIGLGALVEFDYRLVTTHKEQTDAIRLLKYNSLYNEMEYAIDKCEDLMNAIEAIMLKNA